MEQLVSSALRRLYIPTNWLLVLTSSALLQACEDVVTIELDTDEEKVFIDAVIENGKAPEVIVGLTTAYYNHGSAPKMSGAVVSIFDTREPSRLVYLTETEEEGHYTTEDFVGETNRVYTLQVEVDGVVYTATDSLKPVPPIDNIRTDFNTPTDPNRSVIIDLQDPPNESNYYRWIMQVDTYIMNEGRNLIITDDRFFDGETATNLVIYNGRFLERIRPGVQLQLRQISLSHAAFQFYKQLRAISVSQGLFSTPQANVPTNFSNGAVGFFRAVDVFYSEKIIVEE